MAITVNSNLGTGNSLDFNADIDNYDGEFSGTNRGWFYGGATLGDTHSQYGNDSAGDGGAGDSTIFGGTFNYVFGTFTGTMNSISFGEDVNYTGSGNVSTTALTHDSTLFNISGLSISGSSSSDPLQQVALSFLNGTAKTAFRSAFNGDNITFNGNAGNETFTGGRHDGGGARCRPACRKQGRRDMGRAGRQRADRACHDAQFQFRPGRSCPCR